jgi:hypothetical protein
MGNGNFVNNNDDGIPGSILQGKNGALSKESQRMIQNM